MVTFNYVDTFDSVLKFETVRIILIIVIAFTRSLKNINVNNVFLNGTIIEEVYMCQVAGFVDNNHPTYVCKLQKILYGLNKHVKHYVLELTKLVAH